jgi:hypothetical protein
MIEIISYLYIIFIIISYHIISYHIISYHIILYYIKVYIFQNRNKAMQRRGPYNEIWTAYLFNRIKKEIRGFFPKII